MRKTTTSATKRKSPDDCCPICESENDDKEGTLQRIAEAYPDAEIDHLDGVTVQYPDWWFNVRASNTEPLLRLNMEARNDQMLLDRLAELTPLLGQAVDY